MKPIQSDSNPRWSKTVDALLTTAGLSSGPTDERKTLERMIECAIVVCWDDLLKNGRTGSVHVEYAFAPTGGLSRLEVWASTVGRYWLLACTYAFPSSTPTSSARFENGYKSERLAHILGVLMRNQKAFIPPQIRSHGLLQVNTPNRDERAAAEAIVESALEGIESSVQTT